MITISEWTWTETPLASALAEGLEGFLLRFLKEPEKSYKARVLRKAVWWDRVAEEVASAPEGTLRLDAGEVARSYIRRYREATTSYLLLHWAEGTLWAFWSRLHLGYDGKLPGYMDRLSPFHLAWKLEAPSLLERARRLDQENRAKYGADLPENLVFPRVWKVGHLVLWNDLRYADEEEAGWVSVGQRAFEVPGGLPRRVWRVKPETLAKNLAKTLGAPPELLRKAVNGEGSEEELGEELWEEVGKRVLLSKLQEV